ERPIDLAVAERLLDDPALYSQATHLITETPSLAARPVGTAPASDPPSLTGVAGSLSSGIRNP
ncbi:MAG: hypothetical protein WB678_18395, partial [Stellaceae bacterium]